MNNPNDFRFLRQQDAVNMVRLSNLKVSLIGAGSIGSTTAVWLAKMGIKHLTVFDDDLVEEHNWSNQIYREADIGRPKCEALWDVMESLCSYRPDVILQPYVDQPLTEIVISGVDSMSSRKAIWKSVRSKPEVQLYIGARMGLETLVVHSVNPQVREERQVYVKTLCDDADAMQEPCTARTICYTPLMAASLICSMVKRYVNGESMPKQVILDLVTWTMMG